MGKVMRTLMISGGRKLAFYSHELIDEIKIALQSQDVFGLVIEFTSPDMLNLNFLHNFLDIKILYLMYCSKKVSFDIFKDLKFLEELTVCDESPEIDFCDLQSLKFLAVDWRYKLFKNIDKSNIRELMIWKYKSVDLEGLNGFEKIESLYVNKSTIESLNGLQNFSRVKSAKFFYVPKLLDISTIEICDLKELCFINAKNIDSYRYLSGCKSLERLRINQSAPIESLNFINELNKLRSFRFMKTDLIDGNLSGLLKVDDVSFTYKKHFSHNLDDFNTSDSEIYDC
jgi:protein phosphatase 1 regulatory subunit 7